MIFLLNYCNVPCNIFYLRSGSNQGWQGKERKEGEEEKVEGRMT